jgi:hypothetical protein
VGWRDTCWHPCSHQLKERKAALVVVAVENLKSASGRIRMEVIPDFKAETLNDFIHRNVTKGSTLFTDG